MDFFDILTAKALAGGGGGGGGNPNIVQTVNGTVKNPFVNIDTDRLCEAVYNHEASVYMEADGTALGAGIIKCVIYAQANNGILHADHLDITNGDIYGYLIVWYDGTAAQYKAVQSGTITDILSYAEMVPTTTTIIWHPLP